MKRIKEESTLKKTRKHIKKKSAAKVILPLLREGGTIRSIQCIETTMMMIWLIIMILNLQLVHGNLGLTLHYSTLFIQWKHNYRGL